MVIDETVQLRKVVSPHVKEAIEALTTLSKLFGRETISAAIGELSELLIAEYTGGRRTPRGTMGHDVQLPNGDRVEVKSRFLADYGNSVQFNFRRHTEHAHSVYCVVWVAKDGEPPRLETVLKVSVPFLMKEWGKPNQVRYSARTNLGALRRAAKRDWLVTA